MIRRALIVGTLAGALFLGLGTRLSMRGVALVEQRVAVWTIGGTLRVTMFGTLFGLGFSLLWIAIARWLPSGRIARGLLFGAVLTLLASPGLTPRRVSTFLLFTPWFLMYGMAMSTFAPRKADIPRAPEEP